MTIKLTESQEDYLEAIYSIERTGKSAGVTVIASNLKVRKPSVTAAMKLLVKKGLVLHGNYGDVILTTIGRKYASEVALRHEALRDLFVNKLGLPEKVADRNACRMEHALEPDVLTKLIKILN
ncbi:MAG: metal-dependent transcriptional regulator [Fibrobacteres bacterium]|nr:metal-dependent transcriptional regulator [Fibrobacterota bacterium]